MRQVRDSLYDPPKTIRPHLAQQDGQYNGGRKSEHQPESGDYKGIPEQTKEIDALEKFGEVLETHPFRGNHAQDSAHAVVVVKRNGEAEHRQVVENEVVNDSGKHEQVEELVLDEERLYGHSLPGFLRASG